MSKSTETAMFNRFRSWCAGAGKEPSPAQLQVWDEEHNHSLIRAQWTRDEILAEGLKQKYSQFFYRFAMITAKVGNKRVELCCFRQAVSRVAEEPSEIVDLGNSQALAGHKGTARLDAMKEKIKRQVSNAVLRLRLLNMTRSEIVALVNDAMNEALALEHQAVAAD